MLEGGVQLHQLSAYLGHSSLKPTLVYLHLTAISEGRAREALKTLPLPKEPSVRQPSPASPSVR